MNKEFYVLKYPNGKILAIDLMSGGYPYETDHPASVNYWSDPGAAQSYADTFRSEGLKVCKVELKITDL